MKEVTIQCPRCFCPARYTGSHGIWRCLSGLCKHLFKVIAVTEEKGA